MDRGCGKIKKIFSSLGIGCVEHKGVELEKAMLS